MNPLILKIQYILFFVVMYSNFNLDAQDVQPEIDDNIQKTARISDERKRLDVDIFFYGRVVDQFGNSVVGANVYLCITRYDSGNRFGQGVEQYSVMTNSEGVFSVVGKRGKTLSIEKIEKEDYVFSIKESVDKIGFSYSGQINNFIPDRDHPIVYKMRKQTNPVFIISNDQIEWLVKKNDFQVSYFQNFQERSGEYRTGSVNDGVSDISFSIMEQKGKWMVFVRPNGELGGAMWSDVVLSEAPMDGYKKEVVFIPEDRKPLAKKYLYIRSRTPALYSLLSIEFTAINNERIWLKAISLTNPYGDRNLEEKKDLPFDLTQLLTDDAVVALGRHEYPDRKKAIRLIGEYVESKRNHVK